MSVSGRWRGRLSIALLRVQVVFLRLQQADARADHLARRGKAARPYATRNKVAHFKGQGNVEGGTIGHAAPVCATACANANNADASLSVPRLPSHSQSLPGVGILNLILSGCIP
jgi:hypothetical protein